LGLCLGQILQALRTATWTAFATITLADIAGWVTHTGYLVSHQPS